MPCLPPMTGNGNHTTHKHGDDWGMAYDCFTHIKCSLILYLTTWSSFFLLNDLNGHFHSGYTNLYHGIWSTHGFAHGVHPNMARASEFYKTGWNIWIF